MNDKIMLGGVTFSLLVSIAQLVLSLLMVPHIFGIMLSITFIIINILILIYVLKVKKVLSSDVKMQYEELGRKRNESYLFKTMRIIMGVSYVSANILMVIMIITRSASLVGYNENAMRSTFPYMCDEDSFEGCVRLVLALNSCKHTGAITAKDYSLIMNTQVRNHRVGYYINYCAQSIDIGSLKYPDSWPDANLTHGFIHQVVETTFLGLIDDIYISWQPFGAIYTLVEMQSAPRFGGALGLTRNQQKIEDFYLCMKVLTSPEVYQPHPCSANA